MEACWPARLSAPAPLPPSQIGGPPGCVGAGSRATSFRVGEFTLERDAVAGEEFANDAQALVQTAEPRCRIDSGGGELGGILTTGAEPKVDPTTRDDIQGCGELGKQRGRVER